MTVQANELDNFRSARVSSSDLILLIFINPSGTKSLGTHISTKEGGGRNEPSQYLKNDKCYKPETLGGVRGVLQNLKKFQVDITAFAW